MLVASYAMATTDESASLDDVAAAIRSIRAFVQAVAITQSELAQRLDGIDEALLRLNSGVADIQRMMVRLVPDDPEQPPGQ